MATALSILGALLILSVLIVVHELGHYSSARLLDVKVMEFGIGLGPKLYSRVKNDILYTVRLFPIGGFCRFYGEDEAIKDQDSFGAQKIWKRFIILFSGAFLNIVFAVLLAIFALVAYGDYVPKIVNVLESNPAAVAGLMPDDIIVSVNGREVIFPQEVVPLIEDADPVSSKMVIKRDGKLYEVTLQNFYSEAKGRNYIGVELAYNQRRTFSFGQAVTYSFRYVWYIIKEMFSFLGKLFVPGAQVAESMMGPVGTISTIGSAIRIGFEWVLQLTLLISINLGVVNLLPFPGLDGARLVFLGLEKARGKAVSPDREGVVHFVGLVLLLGLMVFLTYGDIVRLIGG